jgi:hypothetical protein
VLIPLVVGDPILMMGGKLKAMVVMEGKNQNQ